MGRLDHNRTEAKSTGIAPTGNNWRKNGKFRVVIPVCNRKSWFRRQSLQFFSVHPAIERLLTHGPVVTDGASGGATPGAAGARFIGGGGGAIPECVSAIRGRFAK